MEDSVSGLPFKGLIVGDNKVGVSGCQWEWILGGVSISAWKTALVGASEVHFSGC